ncbi:RNA polymerase sigma factor [Streptomyces sp. NPDC005407]|uniref:RNA polymerase sigma factor n=1 Tax=Streptomyces sp. NPDC005407 TaxID=3155340 RepID=UPI0033AADEE5
MSEHIENQEVDGVPMPRRSQASDRTQIANGTFLPASSKEVDGPLASVEAVDGIPTGGVLPYLDLLKSVRGQLDALIQERGRLVRFIKGRGVDQDSAEDLANDTYLIVIKSMARGVVPELAWRQYMYGIANKKIIGHWREQIKHRRHLVYDDDALTDLAAAEITWEDMGGGTALPRLFELCIGVLSKYQAQVLYLRNVVVMEYDEIAGQLERSEDAVRRCHSDALHKIRSKLWLMARIRFLYRRRSVPYAPENNPWKKPEEK